MSGPLLLVDLSNNNNSAAFTAALNARPAGIWHKVSEGDRFTDALWRDRAALLRRHRIRVGGYHFARPKAGDAKAQAVHFVTSMGKVQRRDLRPVLDLEANDDHLEPGILTAWVRQFNSTVKALTGVGPLLYSYPAFLAALDPPAPLGYGLWLAGYGSNDGSDHGIRLPPPWRRLVAHQFTSAGRLKGYDGDVDLSHAAKLRPLLAHPFTGRI